MTAQLPKLEWVDITEGEYGFLVEPVYGDVDRRKSFGLWAVRPVLANRLKTAILAGVALPATGIATDVNGQTYPLIDFNVHAKQLNADLKQLGF